MCLILDFLECLELGEWVFSFGIFGVFGIFGIIGIFGIFGMYGIGRLCV